MEHSTFVSRSKEERKSTPSEKQSRVDVTVVTLSTKKKQIIFSFSLIFSLAHLKCFYFFYYHHLNLRNGGINIRSSNTLLLLNPSSFLLQILPISQITTTLFKPPHFQSYPSHFPQFPSAFPHPKPPKK